METKSIEQLEKDSWKEPSEFPTEIVEKCHRYRKISIAELTNEQMRLLISQEIGIDHLIGPILRRLEQNILAEGNLYKGDLLVSISRIPSKYWAKYESEFHFLKEIVDLKSDLIKPELGEKGLDRLLNRLSNGL